MATNYQINFMQAMYRLCFFLFCVISVCCNAPRKATTPQLPGRYNIVLIVADDLGRNDLACYGNQFIETPHLGQMAKEGIRFTNAYAAAPLCSPTRASIITGNNPARINLTEHLHGYAPAGPKQKLTTPKIETGLPPQLTTIPEALNPAGYTTAHFGKWHLGGGSSSPAAQGFQFVYGGGQEGLPKTFFYPFFNGKPYPALLADTKEGDYLDDALTTKALQFMQNKKDSSFFIELNFYAPHVPIEGKPELVKKYQQKRTLTGFKGLPEDEYAAMVENIDYNVGRVIRYLKESGLDKNTVVIFTSDNGGLDVKEVPAFAKHTPPTSNAPLRAGKGYLYEGGIREPWIVWMPSVVTRPREETTMVTSDDVFKTCMQLAGVNAKSPDGLSIVPLLFNQSLPARDYYLHFPHYSPQHGKPGAVIRRGNYKMIEWYEDGKLELFDLSKDESETTNLAVQFPQLVNDMKEALEKWRKDMRARMTEPNPLYRKE
jgi:arylsulfatase A